MGIQGPVAVGVMKRFYHDLKSSSMVRGTLDNHVPFGIKNEMSC